MRPQPEKRPWALAVDFVQAHSIVSRKQENYHLSKNEQPGTAGYLLSAVSYNLMIGKL